LVDGTAQDPLAIETTIYREDGGAGWTAVMAAGIDRMFGGAVAIAADPSDRDRLYATDGASFYTGAMGGASFTGARFGMAFPPSGLRNVRGLYADPSAAGRLLLATDQELFESSDRGATWGPLGSLPRAGWRSVAFQGATTFAIADEDGLFTASGGGAFAPAGACLFAPSLRTIAVAPDDASLVFIGAEGAGLYRSTDAALHFAPQSSGIDELLGRVVVTGSGSNATAWIASAAGLYRLEADPSDPGVLLVATNEDLFEGGGFGLGVARISLASGQVERATGLGGRNVARIAFDPRRAGHVYAYQVRGTREDPSMTAIGLYASDDGGRRFVATSLKSLDTAPFYAFTFPSSPLAVSSTGAVFAGALARTSTSIDAPIAHEVWRSMDGATFQRVWSDQGAPDEVANGLYASPRGPVYIAGRFSNGPLLRSADGTSFAPMSSGVLAGAESVVDLAVSADGGLYAVSGSTVAHALDATPFMALRDGFDPHMTAVAVAYLPASGSAPALVFIATLSGGILWRTAP
jgi:hypothetical protein